MRLHVGFSCYWKTGSNVAGWQETCSVREAKLHTLNLVLKFKFTGNGQLHVKGAARIQVDGLGNLLLCDAEDGTTERIELKKLESLEIHPFINLNQPPVPAAANL
jgi:hypothetical protein